VRLFLVLLLSSLAACGCDDQVQRPARPAPISTVAPQPPVMECRFEPVSLPRERPQSGFEMCYSQAEPQPWWTRVSSALDAGASAAVLDAGSSADAGAPPEPEAPCPEGMVLVEGDYCPTVRHRCLRYLDDAAGGAFMGKNRCAEFATDVTCAAERQHRRFCIDRDEYVAPDDTLPLVEQSWTSSKELCDSLGKRLCFESEWEFACEGEQMLPYPYGFVRDAKLCNHDQTELTTRRGKMRDLRVAPADRPKCTSPFGVRNLVGNVDEWTQRDGFVRPWRASMRGGWWLAGRNNCRAATTGHDEYYHGPQTGFRCCANAR
jgi:hypothetical protein